MEQLISAVKNEKVSASLGVVILLLAYYAMSWANEQHEDLVSKDQYDRGQSELKVQMSELTSVVRTYIEDQKIVSASQLIRDKELALQVASHDDQQPLEVERLREEIEAAKRYRECLISQRPNCKHLKPPE